MIRVTVFNENVQEHGTKFVDFDVNDPKFKGFVDFLEFSKQEIAKVHPNGIHETLRALFDEEEDMTVRVATMDMPEHGLTQEVIDNTDVLVWWAHIAHDKVSDEVAQRVRDAVLRGMGLICLHSAHPSKPMQLLLGTTGSLQWREGDRSRVWCTCPTHPIAKGIPLYIDLPQEEMYGEYFDIPKPDDLVFVSWYSGGEIFRSGCTWTRGYGKIFYFQPGHETHGSYHIPAIRQILKNAVRWAEPVMRVEKLDCPNTLESPEAKYAKLNG